jgi:hypothetical protein
MFCIPESPKFLINAGRIEEAEWSLTKIARFNGRPDFCLEAKQFEKILATPISYNVLVKRENGRRIDVDTVGSVKAFANLNPHADKILRTNFKESLI